MARVGTIVFCGPASAGRGRWTGPVIRARRRPSVPDGVICFVVELQLDAAEAVAAALVVGGEHGAANQLAKEPRRRLVKVSLAEGGDWPEVGRVLGGELELASARRGWWFPLPSDSR